MPQQGSRELLNDPVASALLSSVNPARLAYTWTDGSPRVVPIWFHWTGEQLRDHAQKLMACPVTASAASPTISARVGCACTLMPSSAVVPSTSLA